MGRISLLDEYLHHQLGFGLIPRENSKLDRNDQPPPASGAVVKMNILGLRKICGFVGKLTYSIFSDVVTLLHQTTPNLTPYNVRLFLGAKAQASTLLVAVSEKTCGKTVENLRKKVHAEGFGTYLFR